jgi:hypothetical protein
VVHHEQPDQSELDLTLGELAAVPTGHSDTELTLSCWEPRGGQGPVPCELVYATDLFDPATARSLVDDLVHTLRRM